MRFISAVGILMMMMSGAAIAQEFRAPPWFSASKCSRTDSDAADADLDRLTSWAAVYRTFARYKQCDDGGVAEGYSDRVVTLLTEHWPTVGALARLTRRDPEFGEFVVRHVDSLMTPDQGRAIVANAERHCPADAKAICRRLAAQARNP